MRKSMTIVALTTTILLVLFCSACFAKSKACLHHIFPKEFERVFLRLDIVPDLYTIPVASAKDRKKILSKNYQAGNNNNYIGSWKWFFATYPNEDMMLSKETCFAYATVLLDEYGFSGSQSFYDCTSRQPTGECINVIRTPFVRNTKKNYHGYLVKAVGTVAILYLADNILEFAIAYDDSRLDSESLKKAENKLSAAISAYSSGRNNDVVITNLADMYFYIGKAFMSKYVDISEKSEFMTRVTGRDKELLDNAVQYLKKARALNTNEPVYDYYLGMAYFAKGDNISARSYLMCAMDAFKKDITYFRFYDQAERMLNAINE